MKHTLILTKLNIPPPRPNLILRERLTERLNAGIQGKLTLVTAMAGSGKTTLVSEWVHANQLPAAWVNLEQEDNDPTRFFLYVIAAIQRIDGKLGTSSLICLQSPQALPPETLLTDLINDISSQAKQIILVLDDYHVIDNQVHLALVKGDLAAADNPLVRVHLQDTLGDVVGVPEPVNAEDLAHLRRVHDTGLPEERQAHRREGLLRLGEADRRGRRRCDPPAFPAQALWLYGRSVGSSTGAVGAGSVAVLRG